MKSGPSYLSRSCLNHNLDNVSPLRLSQQLLSKSSPISDGPRIPDKREERTLMFVNSSDRADPFAGYRRRRIPWPPLQSTDYCLNRLSFDKQQSSTNVCLLLGPGLDFLGSRVCVHSKSSRNSSQRRPGSRLSRSMSRTDSQTDHA